MVVNRKELFVILGALSAFASLSVDMYLPAFPALQKTYGVEAARVQWTLATFFIGFALGQAVYGPLSDRFGRKPPLYVSLSLFSVVSALCAMAPSIEVLMVLRFLQAVGACAGGVITRAMVRDIFEPRDAIRIYSYLMLVTGLAPMLAPLLGGYLLVSYGWRSIFWLLTGLGLLCLLTVALRLPETHRADASQRLSLLPILEGYGRLLRQRQFIGYVLTGGVSMAGMFAYIAGSPFVFINLYQVPPERYGWIFGGNALGYVFSGQVNARLVRRTSPGNVLRAAGFVQALAGVCLLAAVMTGSPHLAWLLVPLFVFIACMGFIMPNAAALAMEPHSQNAGSASALLGTLQFGSAALSALIVGRLENATAVPMAQVMAVSGVLSLAVHYALVIRQQQPVVTAA